jgi:hypothetical protein
MKTKILLITLLSSNLFSSENLNEILKKSKKDIIIKEKQQSEYIKNKNNLSWINDVNIQLDIGKQEYNGMEKDFKKAGIYINQNIYKGGNIYEGIKYSNTLNNLNQTNLLIKTENYINKIIYNLIQLDGLNLQLKQLKLEIKSNQIDYERKYELYKNGLLAISFVSDLIIKKNILLNKKIKLENSIKYLKIDIKKYTKEKTEVLKNKINIKKYTQIISKEDYIKKNYIQTKRKELKLKNISHRISKNKLYPTVSIYGNTEYLDDGNKDNTNYNVGLKVNIPLSINKYKDIQVEQQKKLLAISEFNDNIKNEELIYDQKIIEIKSIYEKVKNIEVTILEYKKLINNLKEDVNIGLSTKNDLKLLEIKLKIQIIQKEIYLFDIRKLAFDLNMHIFHKDI